MTYLEACEKAKQRSEEFRCAVHVCAIVALADLTHAEPYICGYAYSDWVDGTTVKSYANGKEVQ